MDEKNALQSHLGKVRRTYVSLGLDQEIDLGKKIEQGDMAARDQLVLANLDVAIAIARRYSRSRADELDLIQEGYVALLEAASKYDWRQGVLFGTYAKFVVRSAVIKGRFNTHLAVRLPRSALEARYRLKQVLDDHPGDVLSAEEIAKLTGDHVRTVKSLLDYDRYVIPVSLEGIISACQEMNQSFDIADKTEQQPQELVMATDVRRRLHGMLEELPWKYAVVLVLRFGLDQCGTRTESEIALQIGVTQPTVSKRQQKAYQLLLERFGDEIADMLGWGDV